MKKVIAVVIFCIIAFWIVRIISINLNPPLTEYYNIGDKLELNGIEFLFLESHLEDPEEFTARTGISFENDINCECKLISLCIEVTNKSNEDFEWDYVIDCLNADFESPECWSSACNPDLLYALNEFRSDSLYPGVSQKIWFTSVVNEICFKEKAWKKIEEYKFIYVLSCFKNRTAVRINV